jgi:hypothetical protein
MLATQSGDTTTTILKKANGDVCFQDTVSASTKTETIYDPAGVETAVILGAGSTYLRITCLDASGTNIETQAGLTTSQCADYYASFTQVCTPGTCVW